MSDSSSIRAAPHCASGGRSLPSAAPGKNGHGGVAEWLKAHAWRACIRATVSRVRIPLPPPPKYLSLLIYISLWLGQKSSLLSAALRRHHRPGGRERPLPDSRYAANRAIISVGDCGSLERRLRDNASGASRRRVSRVVHGETSGKFGNTLAEMLAVSKSPDRGASSGEASAGEIAS